MEEGRVHLWKSHQRMVVRSEAAAFPVGEGHEKPLPE